MFFEIRNSHSLNAFVLFSNFFVLNHVSNAVKSCVDVNNILLNRCADVLKACQTYIRLQ